MLSYQGSINGTPYWYSVEEHRLVSTPPGHQGRVDGFSPKKTENTGSVKALWLSLTNACNLKCPYCFTSNLTSSKERMTLETAEASVEFLIREALADEQGNYNRTIIFFGGEPLINWDLITHTVAYAKSRTSHLPVNIKYMLATNGTLLKEEHVKFLASNDISVQLSLDGPEDVHNRTRKKAGGRGSHKDTIRGVDLLLKWLPDGGFSVRPTVTEHGPSLLNLSQYFVDLGVKNIFLKNVIPQSKDSEVAILEWIKKQENEKEALAEIVVSAYRDGISINPMIGNAMKLMRGVKNESACAAGNHALSIAPSGKVFPCHRYEEDEGMILSETLDTLDSDSRKPYWQQLNDTLRECNDCWARYFCEKGCPASNHFAGNESSVFFESFCEMKKFEAEVSIKTALLLIGSNQMLEELCH